MATKTKPGKAANGNVTVIDFGEKHHQKIEKMIGKQLAEAGLKQTKRGIGAAGKPFLSLYQGRNRVRPISGLRGMSMGPGASTLAKFAGGAAVGIAGNRGIVTFLPMVWGGATPLISNGIAFVAGLLPLAFKQNAMSVGVATPGAVFLGGYLVDKLFAMLSGPTPARQGQISGHDVTTNARQKLAHIQSQIHAQSGALPRVIAQPVA